MGNLRCQSRLFQNYRMTCSPWQEDSRFCQEEIRSQQEKYGTFHEEIRPLTGRNPVPNRKNTAPYRKKSGHNRKNAPPYRKKSGPWQEEIQSLTGKIRHLIGSKPAPDRKKYGPWQEEKRSWQKEKRPLPGRNTSPSMKKNIQIAISQPFITLNVWYNYVIFYIIIQ